MNKTLRTALQIILFFGIGALILFLVFRNQQAAWQAQCALDNIPAEDCSLLDKMTGDFRLVKWPWMIVVLLLFTLSNISRTIRWMMLIEPLGYKPRAINGYLTIVLGYFANLGFPRIGEVTRAATFARYEGIPVEKVMGTVVVDRMIDLLCMLLVTGLAFLLQLRLIGGFLGQYLHMPSNTLIFVGIAVLFFMLLVWVFRNRWIYWKPIQKVARVFQGFAQGLQTVRQVRRPGWFIFHSLNIWLMFYLMTYIGFFAFEPTAELGPLAGLVVFVVGTLGFIIPSPGGMGTFHYLVTEVLSKLYFIPPADAFSLANILFFTIQVFFNVSLGILSLILLPMVNRKK